ncbi:hypothetical protein BH09ACT7_BH09ACT7_14870 [soil metagenome]
MLLPPGAVPPEFSPGRSPAVGGDGVLTVVALAEFPPLMVMLGPAPPLPVSSLPVAGAGASEADGATVLDVAEGAEVAGAVLTSVVTVELESVPLSSLLQPDNKATVAAADERVRNAVR